MPNESKVDLRVQKTQQALVEAMLRLLKEKPYASITVSDLCDAAQIRRATFYKHFHDKNDFLDFCLTKRQMYFEDTHCEMTADPLAYCTTIVSNIIHFMEENDALLVCGNGQRGGIGGAAEMFAQKLSQSILRICQAYEAEGCTLIVPPEIIAAYFSGAMAGVAKWWHLQAPHAMTEEAMYAHLQTLMTACMVATKKSKMDASKEDKHERKPAQ